MSSTFFGIELGKRGLLSNRDGMQTIGHNLASSTKEGYSRQRVTLKAEVPLNSPSLLRAQRSGQIGQGVITEAINRIRDDLLDSRIINESNSLGYWTSREKYMSFIENIYNEVEDFSLRKRFNDFWSSLQDLSNSPESLAIRSIVIEKANGITEGINDKFNALREIYNMANDEIEILTKEVNTYTSNIASLNSQISRAQANGDNPNDLMDERNLLLDKLSEIIEISVEERGEKREFQVYSEGRSLVEGSISNKLILENRLGPLDGKWLVKWPNGEIAYFKSGKLGSIIEVRERDLRTEIEELNNLAINFKDAVNEVHTNSHGMDKISGRDFFTIKSKLTDERGKVDTNGNGEYDSIALFKIAGTQEVKANDSLGFNGTLRIANSSGIREINYEKTDSVQDVLNKINNSDAELSARINENGKVELKTELVNNENHENFVIRYIEDSNAFLTTYAGILNSSGEAGAFNAENIESLNNLNSNISFTISPDKNPAQSIKVSQDLINDPLKLAASFSENGNIAEGNNRGALKLASIESNIMLNKKHSISDYFSSRAANIALKGEVSKITRETTESVIDDLKNLRESISGVNKDEELSNMIEFQQGFMATSRFISEVNKMLDAIINLG